MKTLEDIVAVSLWLKKHKLTGQKKVIAQGGSWGGTHTHMLAVHSPEAFEGFISLIPGKSHVFGSRGLFGWLLLDDILVDRDKNGDVVNYDLTVRKSKRISAFENIPTMKILRPLLTIGAFNDDRTGPEQSYVMTLGIREHHGMDAPTHILMTGGGHSRNNAVAHELAFFKSVMD